MFSCPPWLCHPAGKAQCHRLGRGHTKAPELEQRWCSTRCSPTTICSPPSSTWSFLPFLFPFFLLPFPLDFPRPDIHWADTTGVQREVTPGIGLPHAQETQNELFVCVWWSSGPGNDSSNLLSFMVVQSAEKSGLISHVKSQINQFLLYQCHSSFVKMPSLF